MTYMTISEFLKITYPISTVSTPTGWGNTWGIDPSTLGWTSLGRCKDIFQVATSQLIDAGQSDFEDELVGEDRYFFG